MRGFCVSPKIVFDDVNESCDDIKRKVQIILYDKGYIKKLTPLKFNQATQFYRNLTEAACLEFSPLRVGHIKKSLLM